MNFLSVDGGLVNKLLSPFLDKPIFFLGEKHLFRPILVVSETWKATGWASIIYLAAITRINPELYEAAIVDGANRGQRIWHITIPGIVDVMVVLLILRLGNLLNVGFEQNIVLVNDLVRETGEILDTYVWRLGLQEGRFSLAAAAGLFKTVIAAILRYRVGLEIEPRDIRRQLDEAKGEDIEIQIASPGGFVSDGLEIFNLIRNYEGGKTTHLMGIAASMASYIAMAGDTVRAEDNVVFMIHNVWGLGIGDYRELRKTADIFEGLTGTLSIAYAKKSGKDISEVRRRWTTRPAILGKK